MIRKPNHQTRPNRYNAARDPHLAELRNAPYGKPVAASSYPAARAVKVAIALAVLAFLLQPVVMAAVEVFS